ncbi:MAG: DNA polymerase III subunit alpha [Spirochaetota bacterium]|nr:MAG: DNA polymerase III subunit alpha [Spirochaetota bacterium]
MIEHSPFVHLHTHSEYSVLDGASKIDDLVKKAMQYKMPALALTDHGNMFGALEFYQKATTNGVKPIIGEEFYVARDSMKKREKGEKPYHLIMLAKDEEGYRNLLYLSSYAYLEGFYYRPRVDKQLIADNSKGLIATSSCLGGEIPFLINAGRYEEAKKQVSDYIDIFGKENFYLELMNNGIQEQVEVNRGLIKLAGELGIKIVATNDVHYLEKHDAEYHDVLLCIQTGKTISETRRLKFKTDEFYFRSPQEMISLFSHYPEAIKNTLEVTEKCNLSIELGKFHLPHFPIPEGYNAESYLRKLAEEGIKKRYSEVTEEGTKRLEMELKVIESMGFSTYFLIVWDFIQYARSQGIAVGPGRGSAAGSIVAYSLGITDVDPLKYGLLFERFLNVSRISMPDIDIDFDGDRRDEVISYVRRKYGDDKVAQIITFGAMKARAVIRDVARAMDIQQQDADALAKMIPQRHDMTIEEALKASKGLEELVRKNQRVNRLFEISKKLEKLVRHPSTHAAGVVISPVPLTSIVPLYRDPKSEVISTQYQAKNLEEVGLIKMDFLGLKNLTVIEECLKKIEDAGLKAPDMENLDLDDKEVYELLASGRSMGTFQLESSGMQNLLKRLKPNRFDDIIAVLALYRPGPLDAGMVDEFIERKNGKKPIIYAHPKLEKVLKETYGIIVYQEQVMEIARVISGFSMAEADNLRKAMGKKKPEILEETKETFVDRAEKSGAERTVSEEIFELIKTFGRYGFNKSHSTAYALVAFQTAYLKVHYPVYYLSSLLTGELHDTDKIAQYISEAREMGIECPGPDVNQSGVGFEVQQDSIRYALSAIKNVGESAAKVIVDERKNATYTSILDFVSRVDLRLVNRRVIESLIKSGAMCPLGENRSTLFENLENIIEYGASVQGDRIKGQSGLFDDVAEGEEVFNFFQMKQFQEWSEAEVSEYEREAIGFYLKSHPILKYKELAERWGVLNIRDLKDLPSESQVMIFGIVTSIKRILTKDNKEMAFITLEDTTGSIESVVFPGVYGQYSDYLDDKNIIVVSGKTNGEKIFADKLFYPEDIEKEKISQLHVLIRKKIDEDELLRLRDIFIQHKGKCNVFIHVPELEKNNKAVRASTFLLVDPREDLIATLRQESMIERLWLN